jgi:hypothetical protein
VNRCTAHAKVLLKIFCFAFLFIEGKAEDQIDYDFKT